MIEGRYRLRPSSRPLLSPHAAWFESDGDVVIVGDDMAFTFHEPTAELMRRIRPNLNGTMTLQELAEFANTPPDELIEALDVLLEDAWLIDDAAVHDARDVGEFMVAYRLLCEFWKKDVWARPFWSLLSSGTASRTLLLGWLMEFYHYIVSANEHMPTSVAYCRDDKTVQLWLAQHYTEEYDHSEFFLKGLVDSGLDRDEVVAAPPLASTRAVINYMTEVAATDTVAYAAMHGIFQTPGSTAAWEAQERFYDNLFANYEFGRNVLKAFQDHAMLDAKLGHDDLVFERICTRIGHFTPERKAQILQSTRGLVEHFMLFFDGILDFYGKENAPLPRRPIDIRAFV